MVKDNQPTLHEDIKDLKIHESCPAQSQTCEKGHGRLETRSIWTSIELNGYSQFPHIAQVGVIKRERTEIKTGKTSEELSHWILTAPPEKMTPEKILQLARGHWSIENQLHWVRDVTFDEDRSQVRTKNGPRVMASLRNFAIGLIRSSGTRCIAATTRRFATKPHLALASLGI